MQATVRGIGAARTVTPANLEAAAEALRAAAAAAESVAFIGGGTQMGYGYPPTCVDVLVRTTSLTRVVEYQPADMVVEVECGMTLAALQEILSPNRQRLAIDAPHPERATIGGLVATNAFGPHRTRFGSLRDLIVGVSLVRADGTRVRGGGKVVKNVAGFDLPKLAVGSLGTLGMIATATFRLHPLPQTTTALRVGERSAEQVRALVHEIVARQLEPAAVLAFRANERYDFFVVFEGFTPGVSEQGARLRELVSDLGATCEAVADADDAALLDEVARTYGDVRVRIAGAPADFARIDRDAVAPLQRLLSDAKIVAYPTLGIIFLAAYATGNPAVVDALLAARRLVESAGGNVVMLEAGDADVAERVDVYGTLPPSFALMRGLKDRFDPARRLNPGRFLGKL